MKTLILFFLLSCLYTGYAQNKDNNNSQQIEQLHQVKQTLAHHVDSLNIQLREQSIFMDYVQKKILQLIKESKSAQKKNTEEAKDKTSKLALELIAAENQLDSLQKKFDMRLLALDKAVVMQGDLEEKIRALNKEKNK